MGGTKMNYIYRGLMTLEACSWMIVVYVAQIGVPVFSIYPAWLFAGIVLMLSIALSALSVVKLPAYLDEETDLTQCIECRQADGDFLPVYLAFFFVALSIREWKVMLFVFVVVYIFTLISGTHLFNPLLLLFGYHYYHVVTKNGTVTFIITKQELRNPQQIHLGNLRRINNTTYIEFNKERK